MSILKTRLNPTLDHIIVSRDAGETVRASGIVIPDTFADKPDQGTVLAVGPGGRDADGNVIPMSVKVGDRVLFAKHAGFDVEVDKTSVLILKEANIFAIIKPQEGV